MYYFKFFALLLSFSFLACTEDTPVDEKDLVPASVVTFFENTSKNPENVKWNLLGDNYKVSYTYKNQEKFLVYNSENKVIDKRTEVNPDLFLPEAAEMLTKEYPEAENIKLYAGQRLAELYFVAKFDHNNILTTITFNNLGDVLLIEKNSQ